MLDRPPHPFSLYLEKGWGLRCRCKDCGHRTELFAKVLVERFGPECTADDLKPRLKCAECGSRQITTCLVQSTMRDGSALRWSAA